MTIWIPSDDFRAAPVPVSGSRARSAVINAIASLPSGRLRSDSGHRVDAATAAWTAYLYGRAREIRADSNTVMEIDAAFRPRLQQGPGRADSSSYFALETVDRSGPIHERPLVPQQLLGAIPVQSVDVSKDTYEVKFVDATASVENRPSGKTTLPLSEATADSSLRKLHVFHTGYASGDWRAQQLQRSMSFSEDALKAQRCEWALNNFASSTWLRSGVTGLDAWSLADLPVQRETSTLTYGTTAADTVLQEFVGYLQYFSEVWKGARGGATLRCLISARVVHAISRYSNFAAGGTGLYRTQAVLDMIRGEGFEPTMVHELYNFGGANVDGMVLYADYPDGLRHLLGMAPAPVGSYPVGGTTVTEMAMISGGLICPDRESCYIIELPVTPAGA